MKEHELEALANIHSNIATYPSYHVQKVLNNENEEYRGTEFLNSLAQKCPWLFKVMNDGQDYTISPEIYIKAGIETERGELLGYLIF